MTTVHVLWHTATSPAGDEDRLLGAFSTAERADEVLAALRGQPGFRDWPDGFVIDAYTLDEDGWCEGFAWNDIGPEPRVLDADDLAPLAIDSAPDVFLLQHRRAHGVWDDAKAIGFYSTPDLALAAANRTRTQPGFRSFVEGFSLLGLRVDVVHWESGFGGRDALLHQLLGFSVSSLP